MESTELPINPLSWTLALVPILVLLVLLAVRRWKAPQAGPVGMFVAALVALFALQTPWETLAVASAKGVWDAIFILYVVWPALLLYLVTDRAGGYEALRQGVTRFSRNELFIVVALGWVFSSFLQGVAGFGAPIAIVAPLLVAYGVKPVYAVAIPIIAHIWAKMFGTLAAGWLATLQVVNLENATETAFQAALLLLIQGCVRSGRADVVPFAVGIWIGGAYWFTSSTSFANPAVTVARTLSDTFAGIEPALAPMFIAMQLVGTGVAFGLVRLFYPNDPSETSDV